MQCVSTSFSAITEHKLLTELYKEAELEISEGWIEESGVFFSEAMFLRAEADKVKDCDCGKENDKILIAAYSLSKRYGVTVLDYIAVRKDLRKSGIGSLLLDRMKEKCREFSAAEVYLTAKARDFFVKNGARELSEALPLYEKLLGDCVQCEQRGKYCFPSVMMINIKNT